MFELKLLRRSPLALAMLAVSAVCAPAARAEAIYLRAGAGLGLLSDAGPDAGGSFGVSLDLGAAFSTGMGWVGTFSGIGGSGTQGSSYAIGGGPTVGIESGSARLSAGAILGYAAYTPPGGEASGSFALGPKLNLDLGTGGSVALAFGAQLLFVTGNASFTATTVTLGPKFSF